MKSRQEKQKDVGKKQMKEEAERSRHACKSVSQPGRLKKTRVVFFTLRQHDAFKVSGEYGCSQYCTVMYCHCLKVDLEIIYRVIYSYYYCTQNSDDYTHRKRRENESKRYLDREKSKPLKLSHICRSKEGA